MGNLKGRLERLERHEAPMTALVINVRPGESGEELLQRHLIEHPEDATRPTILLSLYYDPQIPK